MSNKIPSFDYEGAVKESPRKSAKWHFERKPYGMKDTNQPKDTEKSKDSNK